MAKPTDTNPGGARRVACGGENTCTNLEREIRRSVPWQQRSMVVPFGEESADNVKKKNALLPTLHTAVIFL